MFLTIPALNRPLELKVARLLSCAAAVFLVLFTGATSSRAEDKPELLAQASAEKWLALIDGGDFAQSWQTAAPYFQGAITQEAWKSALVAARQPLGKLVSRKLKSATSTESVPGAPDGHYVILQFDTTFANKKAAVETVTPVASADGEWKVSGYFIK